MIDVVGRIGSAAMRKVADHYCDLWTRFFELWDD